MKRREQRQVSTTELCSKESDQKDRYNDRVFGLLSAEEILAELAESRECYERGEYEDFDEALEEISKKYKL